MRIFNRLLIPLALLIVACSSYDNRGIGLKDQESPKGRVLYFPTDQVEFFKILSNIKLGMSEAELSKLFENVLTKADEPTFVTEYPFCDYLPYKKKDKKRISEWFTRELNRGEWPDVIFAAFKDRSKKELVDALWYRDGDVEPVVNGTYNQNLLSIKPGDSVQKLYDLCGKRECDFRRENGIWMIHFSYCAYEGRFHVILARGSDGIITYAQDGTL